MSVSGDETKSSVPPPDRLRRPGLLRVLLDRLLGYDYFISYAHLDGVDYPNRLAERLEQSGFRVFLDTAEYHAGDDLVASTSRRVRMSTHLVLVAGQHALRSTWVLRELQAHALAGRTPIVINVNRALEAPGANPELLQLVQDRIHLPEALETGKSRPTDGVVRELGRSFKATRQQTRRIRYLAAATVAFAVLALAATFLAGASIWYARQAQLETIIAEEKTGVALVKEAETKRLLARSYADAAQIAMRRGDWASAEKSLKKAEHAGLEDPNRILLEMVKVKSALYKVTEAEEILRSLADRPDLTVEEQGMVLLWRGDFELSRSFGSSKAGLELITRASKVELPEAERAYARGLIATTSAEAVKDLELAVTKDPLHPRANAILALFYLHLGRFQDARDRVVFAEQAFPQNPTYRVIHAMACALSGDQVEADRLLDGADSGLAADHRASARALVGLYREASLIDLGLLFDPDATAGRQAAPALGLVGMALRLRNLPSNQNTSFFPLPPLIVSVQSRVLGMLSRMALGSDPRRLADDLEGLTATMPDGLFYFVKGVVQYLDNRSDGAVESFERAATTPSIFKVRKAALCMKGIAGIGLFLSRGEPERPAAARNAVGSIREAEAACEEFPAYQAKAFATFLIKFRELELARRVVAKWERHAPDDPDLPREKALLELESGSFGRAIALAKAFLASHPEDAQAARILASAEVQLADLCNAGSTKPSP